MDEMTNKQVADTLYNAAMETDNYNEARDLLKEAIEIYPQHIEANTTFLFDFLQDEIDFLKRLENLLELVKPADKDFENYFS